MLMKVVDVKGKVRWVNAAYVKSLAVKGEDQTEIEVSGWATKIRVGQAIDEVAGLVNRAMPGSAESLLAQMEGDQAASEQQAVVIGAVLG